MEDNRLIETEEDFGDEDEEEQGEGEEVAEFIPVARLMPRVSHETEDYDDEDEDEDEDYDDEDDDDQEEDDEDDEEEEEEEVEDLIQGEMTSPSVSTYIADGGTLQGAAVINNGLLDDSNNLESCEGKPGKQETGEGSGGNQQLNRGEIDGLFCPICFLPWTSSGEHRIWYDEQTHYLQTW